MGAFTEVEGKCFMFDPSRRAFAESCQYCEGIGGEIASIHSLAQNEAIIALITGDTNAYIGATSDGAGNWAWQDGSPWWEPGAERTDGLHGHRESRIVITHFDDKWHDWGNGDSLHGVICQREKAILR